MFTGIIEHKGTVESLEVRPDGGRLTIQAPTLASALAVSNSIAVNGCCLTIVSVQDGRFSADLSGETVGKTSFGSQNGEIKKGVAVNLEQPLTAGKELGGHFVLGHVDATGEVVELAPAGDGWRYCVEVPEEFTRYVVMKGSITIDGISLTIASLRGTVIGTSIIPYTYEHTNVCERHQGDAVNLEFDVLGKYVERYLEAREASPSLFRRK
jgi:riboflavin synthase